MYDAILFVHVASTLGYFLAHGVFASVTFALNRENHSERLEALERVMDRAGPWSLGSLLVIVVSGIVLMVMGNWWQDAWTWLSLLILTVVGIVMVLFGGVHLGLGLGTEEMPAEGERWYRTVQWGLRLGTRIPMLLTITGLTALSLILWLMMFKPF
jgi:TRAP-type C4-dicarboxylate transport system permease small subunit